MTYTPLPPGAEPSSTRGLGPSVVIHSTIRSQSGEISDGSVESSCGFGFPRSAPAGAARRSRGFRMLALLRCDLLALRRAGSAGKLRRLGSSRMPHES
jgi:hypothetical protein